MSPIDILLIVVGVGYVLARRVIGELLEVKGLLLVPVALTVVGVIQLRNVHPMNATTIAFVAVGIALSVVLGLIRGTTVHLGERDGALWMRYRATSVLLWIVNLALKVAFIPVERSISADSSSAAEHTILLSIGLGILAETAVVVLRAMRSNAVVVWEKGENGAPHQTSDAFDKARAWLNGGGASIAVDAKRLRLPERDW